MRIQTSQKAELFAQALRMVVLGLFAVFVCTLLATVLSSVTPGHTSAAASGSINFQARLESNAGAIAADGYYNVEFKLYSASSGGTAEWTEDWTYNNGSSVCSGPNGSGDCRIRVANGYLTANLGSITAFPNTINWNQQQWLTMNIGGTVGSGTITWDGEMSPRLLLTAVPYAFQAGGLSVTSGSNTDSVVMTAPASASHTITVPDETGTICTTAGSTACTAVYAAASGSGSYIQLQGSTPGTAQTGNFNISGTGIAGTLQAATLDTAGAVALNIGTTNATQINLNQNTAVASNKSLTVDGAATFEDATNSTTAFQVQNASGSPILDVDTTHIQVGIGTTTTAGTLTLNQTSGNNVIAFQTNGTSDAFIGVSNTAGGVMSGSSVGDLMFRAQSGNNILWGVNGSGAAAMKLNSSGELGIGNTNPQYTLDVTGTARIQTTTNSTTAFQVQNSSSANVLAVDTTNTAVILGNDGTPSAETVRGGAASGSNVAGSNLTFDASNGTGVSGSGDLIFRTAPGQAGGITFDSAEGQNDGGGGTVTSLTWSHTTTINSNRLLLVGVSTVSNTVTVSGVTYNGVALTKVASSACPTTDFNPSCDSELWYLVAPTTGTHNVVVTTSAATHIEAGAATYYNVNQTTPLGTSAVNTGSSPGAGNTSVTVTSNTNQLVVDEATVDNTTGSPGSGQTELWQDSFTQNSGSSKSGGAGTTTMSWAESGADWVDIGVPLNPAANSTADTLTDRLHITASGNVGINTASPIATLNVVGSTMLQGTTRALTIEDTADINTTDFVIQRAGTVSSANIEYSLSERSDNTDLWLFGTDGASYWNALQLLWNGGGGNQILSLGSGGSTVEISAGSTGEAAPTLLVLDSKTGSSSDPTGVAGAMYYNATLDEFRCYTEGEWEPCRTQPIDQSYEIDEEWMSGSTSTTGNTTGYGNYNWTLQTITTACTAVSYAAGGSISVSAIRPGILRLTTATSAANIGCRLILSGPSNGATMFLGAGQDIKTSVAVGATSANVMRVGLDTNTTGGTSTGGRSHTGVWWEADPSNNSHWEYCYGNGASATCNPSTVSIAANTFVRLEIQIVSASAVNFSINGTKTSLTSITLDSSTGVFPNVSCWTETSGTAASCFSDYYQLRGDDTSLR